MEAMGVLMMVVEVVKIGTKVMRLLSVVAMAVSEVVGIVEIGVLVAAIIDYDVGGVYGSFTGGKGL